MFVRADQKKILNENGRQVANNDFKTYNMMFNNPIGLSYKKETENEIHVNLQTDLLISLTIRCTCGSRMKFSVKARTMEKR